MTIDISEVQGLQPVIPKVESDSVVVEPLTQGGITVHYDEILECVRKSFANEDEGLVAAVAMQLRAESIGAFAIWVPSVDGGAKIGAIMLCSFGIYGLEQSKTVHIMGINGKGVSIRQWCQAFDLFEAMAREYGFKRIVAETNNLRVSEIADAVGLSKQTQLYKEIG